MSLVRLPTKRFPEDIPFRYEDGVALINSRDVARWAEVRHKTVLKTVAECRRYVPKWFREPGENGSVEMDQMGYMLTLMNMGYRRSMEFRIRVIDAFEVMLEAVGKPAR